MTISRIGGRQHAGRFEEADEADRVFAQQVAFGGE
jgi:hypothetical protein